ncbi:PaaI family thioesterase [Sulfitobacter pseudonitzschiae]|uniref:PaaI family thioesterase n=1 Tax=Pseudosulfitobacter pseudonitzschiae TaxID=1402135 RepID=A0A9Q2NLQ8_9RHOB|nr:PaaI family thioesterase [Pseudosulfitobacter pseudonitzschiae]MBM2293126.1 PaaI family thioesterase [Pseudosulfitobacter pseudonitzschiae]MBM2297813.1 PaaI family thioesterase [Pseudosulfitobacter pseudonitzschiae]MBM2302727.1 PaaI family thioesterase [Pseudosulfitobacter pseudonitzschiae]MBM2312607.1 PaaI family thioesterase [Pseudosulfitobacter pseudonitzschiae]MBM2317423.1 PaaI family thioesterase [Pseudosulfitobacter pseudonitzschiae]
MTDGPGIIRNETGAQTLLGYVVDVSANDGKARCVLDVGAQHGNRHGALHGGIIACILDNAMGYGAAIHSSGDGSDKFLTISMNTQFIASSNSGRVTATGKVTGGGRNLMFLEGELHDEDGRLLATATGVYKKVREAQP